MVSLSFCNYSQWSRWIWVLFRIALLLSMSFTLVLFSYDLISIRNGWRLFDNNRRLFFHLTRRCFVFLIKLIWILFCNFIKFPFKTFLSAILYRLSLIINWFKIWPQSSLFLLWWIRVLRVVDWWKLYKGTTCSVRRSAVIIRRLFRYIFTNFWWLQIVKWCRLLRFL